MKIHVHLENDAGKCKKKSFILVYKYSIVFGLDLTKKLK